MARKVRIFLENTSQHVILKSLNELSLFNDEADYTFFKEILKKLTQQYGLALHAYVIMPTYFEFVATPKYEDTLSKFMQNLGRNYVVYYNKKYERSGTIWDGRYKSSLVEDARFLINIMAYIERQTPEEYLYNSIHKNLFNKKDLLVEQHTLYKEFAFTDKERVEKYAQFFSPNKDMDKFIAHCLDKQLVTGSVDFVKELERLVGMTLISKKRGRPTKQKQNKRKKMYKNLVVLDKEKHKSLKINSLDSLSYAKGMSFVPLVAGEVVLVSASFPVVFTADEEPSIITLVSLGSDSLAINNEGKWIAPYVPSYLRKYPFSLAATKDNPKQKVILIDEESPSVSKSKGKQLFKKNGEQSEALAQAINFLTTHENQMIVSKNVAKVIAESGILVDREISVGEGDEQKVLVNGFKVVDREKLNTLSDDVLADWVRKGIITVIDAHLNSLNHIDTLFKLAMQKQSLA